MYNQHSLIIKKEIPSNLGIKKKTFCTLAKGICYKHQANTQLNGEMLNPFFQGNQIALFLLNSILDLS